VSHRVGNHCVFLCEQQLRCINQNVTLLNIANIIYTSCDLSTRNFRDTPRVFPAKRDEVNCGVNAVPKQLIPSP